MPQPEIAGMLSAVERLLVAATSGDLTPDQVRAAVALEPVPRGAGWLLADSCWIELAEVQRLLDDVFGPGRAHAFAEAGGASVTAYLAAGDAARTCRQAHAACMAALPGRVAVMAPRRYVICASAPARPGDSGAWGPVLAEGTGRVPCSQAGS